MRENLQASFQRKCIVFLLLFFLLFRFLVGFDFIFYLLTVSVKFKKTLLSCDINSEHKSAHAEFKWLVSKMKQNIIS